MALKKRNIDAEKSRKNSIKQETINKKSGKKYSINSTDEKLNLILKRLEAIEKNQKVLQKEEETVISLEKKEISEESVIEHNEEEEIDELKKIEALEEDIKKGLKESPIKRVTYKDVTKGIIGAFFGIIGHFAFVEGTHISEHFSFLRSSLLLITSFFIIIMFLYFSGFRKVDDDFVFKILPVRAIVIFFSSIFTVFFVLLIYGMIGADTSFNHIYNSVAAISILAVIGAGTADLIGKNE